MKICFICPEYPEGPHGGIGSMVQIISRELVKLGHEVRVIGIYSKTYLASDFEIDLGVKVWRLRNRKGKFGWVLPYIQQYRIVSSWVKNKEIDIIEGPDSRGWFAFWPKLQAPIIIRAHGSNKYFAKVLGYRPNMLTSFLEKRSILRADALISVSYFTAAITKQIFKVDKEFEIIHNGIEIPKLDEFMLRGNNRIVFSGSLNRKKGIFQLIEAYLILRKENFDLKMEIYGKDSIDEEVGSVKEYLLKNIPYEYRENISFKGHVTRAELFTVYKTSTMAVFPSFAEAFAMAPLESMVCNCPTIYSKLGSGKELINNGIDGILIDPQKPDEIADAIKSLLANPNLAKSIGGSGRLKVELSFSKDIMTMKTLQFYKKCLEDNLSKINL